MGCRASVLRMSMSSVPWIRSLGFSGIPTVPPLGCQEEDTLLLLDVKRRRLNFIRQRRSPLRWKEYTVRRRLPMSAALFVAIFAAIFFPIVCAAFLSGNQWRESQDRDRARRLAEHRMNARLLRLNI